MNASHDFPLTLVSVFQAVLAASWQGSLAIVLVLLVRRALGLRAPARWHYLLWGVVIVRLLLPAVALPRNPASIDNIPVVAHPFQRLPAVVKSKAALEDPAAASASFRSNGSNGSKGSEPRGLGQGGLATPTASHAFGKSWSLWIWAALVWMCGAMGLGGWFVACAGRLQWRVCEKTFPVDEPITGIWSGGCGRWLGRAHPRILAADWVASPALVGVWRPTLVIPRDALSRYSTEDWEHVFAHEIAHLRRRDHWSQLLLLLALCAHWFNPLVWMGLRALRADRELAADEWALQRWEGERALAYGETLFKMLTDRSGKFFHPGMVGISEDGAQMKQRLRRITAFLPRRIYGSIAGGAAVLALSTVLLGQSVSRTVNSPDKAQQKPEDAPVKLTSQPPAEIPRNVPEEILAAARAGDSKEVGRLLRLHTPVLQSSNAWGALEMLNELIRRRELRPFMLLLDEVLKMPIGKRWDVSEELLSSLVKDGRTDFLDALLAQRFDLQRLSAQVKAADPATAEWIKRRVAEVARQRADIDALGKAASDGDVNAMRKLLDGGVDVNGVGKDKNTPLIRAVFKDRLEAAQLLLDHGAQVDKPRFNGGNYTPLCLAHSVPMAELLKQAGANVQAKLFGRDVSILTYVVLVGPTEVVEWLLQQGLDPKMRGDGQPTLLFNLKDARTAELLLDAGVDPNEADQFGRTALCSARSSEVAQKLIDHGAKVSGLPNSLLPSMIYGDASAGAIEVAIKAGADRDAASLSDALRIVDGYEKVDYPEKDKVRELLVALGAKPPIVAPVRDVFCQVIVSVVDGAEIGRGGAKVYLDAHNAGWSMGATINVQADGMAPIHIGPDAAAATLAVAKEGYATAFAGPFSPPFKEKIDGLHVALTKGFGATIQTVDEEGQPIEGAKLKGYYPGPPLVSFADVITDASGESRVEHIGPARLDVRLNAEGYEADEIADIHLDAARPYRWILRRAQPLLGTVTSLATGQPIAGARIKLAGVRGPHVESYSNPESAPLLAIANARGHFALTTLRSDSTYYLFVEAAGHGGVLLGKVKSGQGDMNIVLGPELMVRGKVIHAPAGLIHGGTITAGYNQYFPIGDQMMSTGHNVTMKPENGEAEFVIGPLYAYPVGIRVGEKELNLDAKDLPKSGLVIDLAP